MAKSPLNTKHSNSLSPPDQGQAENEKSANDDTAGEADPAEKTAKDNETASSSSVNKTSAAGKSIRRDSKGFEKFEDYFSDSDADASLNKTADNSQDESIAEDKEAESPKVRSPALWRVKLLDRRLPF